MNLIDNDEQDLRKNLYIQNFPKKKLILYFSICINHERFVLYFSQIGIVIAWIILIILAYRVSLIETEYKDYDPFAILDVDRVNFSNISNRRVMISFVFRKLQLVKSNELIVN